MLTPLIIQKNTLIIVNLVKISDVRTMRNDLAIEFNADFTANDDRYFFENCGSI